MVHPSNVWKLDVWEVPTLSIPELGMGFHERVHHVGDQSAPPEPLLSEPPAASEGLAMTLWATSEHRDISGWRLGLLFYLRAFD